MVKPWCFIPKKNAIPWLRRSVTITEPLRGELLHPSGGRGRKRREERCLFEAQLPGDKKKTFQGEKLGKNWENSRNNLGKTWENWENHGKNLENRKMERTKLIGKTIGHRKMWKPWENSYISYWVAYMPIISPGCSHYIPITIMIYHVVLKFKSYPRKIRSEYRHQLSSAHRSPKPPFTNYSIQSG